jgi:tRNA A-37 threonylcarbamoyl transferase component Bud32
MPLVQGSRLGAYEIEAAIGAGGMGEVYRARDTKLNRHVALKTLPDGFARDVERVARFRREAQILAALNHPHIAAIHDLHEADGHQFLVLELIDGETLAERIAKGPLSVDETIAIARQIAEALEAAHEKGIVHRDLKPSNIALTADDQVKVLDFGLAKATGASPSSGPNLENSPTITSPDVMTGAGLILGTAAYMSPEQTKGRVADKRSDVWSFGCVLFEMLSGRRPFHGDDVSDTLAAVLKGQPDWNALPTNVPPAVRALIEGCLRKDRRERIGDISTARFLLDQPQAAPQAAVDPFVPPWPWRRAVLVAIGVLASAGVAAFVAWKLKPSPLVAVTRFAFALPQGQLLTLTRQGVTISPDGTRMVYAANGRLYLRSMSGFESSAIPGAEPAISPVFSPDGESLVFWSRSLKRMAVTGGSAVTICQLELPPAGMTWSNEGIVFADLRGILRVSPDGGTPELLISSNADDMVYAPQLLPGRALLFAVVKQQAAAADRWDEARIVVQSLATGVRKTLIEAGSHAQYVPTGHIVYVSGGTLIAIPFDVDRLETTGRSVPIIEGVRRGAGRAGAAGMAHFAFSNTGSLVYVPGPPGVEQGDLVMFDRTGVTTALKLPPGRYEFPRVSPDGSRIAFETTDRSETVISTYEMSGASNIRRLTYGGNNRFPLWSPDGRRLAFQSDRDGDQALFWQPAEGGNAVRLTKPERGTSHVPESWSPDGQVLLFSEKKDTDYSLWTFSLRDGKAALFERVQGSRLPANASFSLDGRWVAYQTGQVGMPEGTTFVQPFPPTGTKHQIGPGAHPLWSRDGKELFFIPGPGRFQVVTVSTQPSFTFTRPVALPRVFAIAHPAFPRPYDMLPDGRFIGVGVADPGPGGPQIHVVLNWFEELKALAHSK